MGGALSCGGLRTPTCSRTRPGWHRLKIRVKNDITTKMPSCFGALPIELLFRERCVVPAGAQAWYLGSDPASSFTIAAFLPKSLMRHQ